RFMWDRQWKHAKKGRDGSKGDYSRPQKDRCVQQAEGFGIFTPAWRERNGAWRTGWNVADHAKISRVEDGWCHLTVNRFVISPRRRGEHLDDYLARTIQETVAAEDISNRAEDI